MLNKKSYIKTSTLQDNVLAPRTEEREVVIVKRQW